MCPASSSPKGRAISSSMQGDWCPQDMKGVAVPCRKAHPRQWESSYELSREENVELIRLSKSGLGQTWKAVWTPSATHSYRISQTSKRTQSREVLTTACTASTWGTSRNRTSLRPQSHQAPKAVLSKTERPAPLCCTLHYCTPTRQRPFVWSTDALWKECYTYMTGNQPPRVSQQLRSEVTPQGLRTSYLETLTEFWEENPWIPFQDSLWSAC